MNNIVKIILGVNIAVGGAGAFFAFSKSGKVGELKDGKSNAEVDLKKAQNQIRTVQGNLSKTNNALTAMRTQMGQLNLNMTKAQTEAAKVPGLLTQVAQYTAMGTPQDVQSKLQQLTDAQTDAAQAKADLQAAQIEAAKVPGLMTQIAQLQAGAKTKPKPKPKPKPKAIAGGTDIGQIVNYDAQNGYYVINRGADIGIKGGDKFTIFRGNQAIGFVVIALVKPTFSIANYDPAQAKPAEPFKPGDLVKKTKN